MAGPLSRPSTGRQAVGFVYFMASKPHGTPYIGVTSDLADRVSQHREGLIEGFTKRYGVKTLVWYEAHETMETAIQREASLKRWPRQWKINLIERQNLHWTDLFPSLF
ncbi:MAG TPA: GIY-YIG nuclease family protein [Alphaproteobacteria bacterium]|nr:GIY-YIG nuclease family protein [Alphaproteobacteria bacterium]